MGGRRHEACAGRLTMAILFWISFALVGWAYVGYPAFMRLRAAVSGSRPAPEPWTPRVAVILAVRNEEARITGRIEDLLAQEYPSDRLEIVVACNGCTDDTEAAARSLGAEHPVTVVVSPPEGGKAEALNRGVQATDAEVLVFADARQRFDARVLQTLAGWLRDPSVGAVSGRLVIGAAEDAAVRGVSRYWEMEVALRQAESDTGSVIGVTGAIYAIRRDQFTPLPPGVILDDVLVPMRIALDGYRVGFEPTAIARDVATPDSRGEFDRKVRTMVGNLEILRIEPRILNPFRNPVHFRYVSHKLLRLLAPVCLIAMLVAGALAGGIYGWLVLGQLVFYSLGALGLVTPLPGLGIPAGFVLTHAAVLVALLRPRRGTQALWGDKRETTPVESPTPK